MRNIKKLMSKTQEGFTLIEILVVIGLIAVLAAIVIIAINPARQFAQGRDAERRSETNSILNAIGQYIADTQGLAPGLASIDTDPALPTAPTWEVIGDTDLTDLFCTELVPRYISAMPIDPSLTADADGQFTEAECTAGVWVTGYQINRDAAGRITVRTNVAEPNIPRANANGISVTR